MSMIPRRGFISGFLFSLAAMCGIKARASEMANVPKTDSARGTCASTIVPQIFMNTVWSGPFPAHSVEEATGQEIVEWLRRLIPEICVTSDPRFPNGIPYVAFSHELLLRIADRIEKLATQTGAALLPIAPYLVTGLARIELRPDGRIIAFMGRGQAFLLPDEFRLVDPRGHATQPIIQDWVVDFYADECFGLTDKMMYGDSERRVLEMVRGWGKSEEKSLQKPWPMSTIRDEFADRDVPLAEWHFA